MSSGRLSVAPMEQRRPRAAPARRSRRQKGRDGDREGRRARHRQNIVGVVLQCNNYEVIDLGVMVPARRSSNREGCRCDIIGLSGLITPSLDEMCHVAAEMEREGFALPLLIGGANHQPRAYGGGRSIRTTGAGRRWYVTDASRAVGVVSQLMSKQLSGAYVGEVRDEYAKIAAAHARAEDTSGGCRSRMRARMRSSSTGELHADTPTLPRHARVRGLSRRRADRLHRLSRSSQPGS